MRTVEPTEAPPTSDSYRRLRRLLDELFQFDQADLDFGIYRIMNQKRAEIARFLDEDLLPQVRTILSDFRAEERTALEVRIEQLDHQLRSLRVTREDSPAYREMQDELASLGSGDQLENEVYSDLYTFFRRYYKEGDFISLRRYKAGVYAIPYEGEEVKLHWANADQYYVKTTESFQDYRFRLPDGRHVHFRLVAAETERDNNKADEDRRFVLREDEPVAEIEGELHIQFEYRPGKAKQKDLNAQAVETLLAMSALRGWRDALMTPQPTAGNGSRTLLEKSLSDYTAKNTFDYFIHKDLGGFLRRELDFFLKNEIAHLDDLDTPDERRAEQYLARLRAIKRIGHKIIDFLAQLEDFQKRLFLKKKFVVATEYCATLDHVPEALYAEIAKNDAQREEWVRLFAIDAIKQDTTRAHSYSAPLTVEFLRGNPHLVLDTRYFDDGFTETLLESIDDIDTQIDGLLINADSFHALRLAGSYFQGEIDCIYIDPPYNKDGEDDFAYKDNFRHSSWLAMMQDRLNLGYQVMSETGVLFSSIDDNEVQSLMSLLSLGSGISAVKMLPAITNLKGNYDSEGFVATHEYVVVATKGPLSTVGELPIDEERIEAEWSSDDHGLFKRGDGLRRTGADASRQRRPRGWFPVFISRSTGMAYVTHDNHPSDEGDIELWPMNNNVGEELSWSWSKDKITSEPHNLMVVGDGKKCSIYKKQRPTIGDIVTRKPKSFLYAPEYSSTSGGGLVRDMFGRRMSSYTPKSLRLIDDLVALSTKDGSWVLDFFAGTGTAGHAVIDLQRKGTVSLRYVLMEMGSHFEQVLKPRILKAIYSKDWKGGKPVSREGSSHFLKYLRLESYEDALNNLRLRERPAAQQRLLEQSPAAREDYLLSYCLDLETDGSASLLDLERFETPFDYRLTVTHGGESRSVAVDLPETFNYLLGLRVRRVRSRDGFSTVEGTDPEGKRVLVIWRSLRDSATDNEALERFLTAQGYADRPTEEALDRVYVNGDNALLNLRPEGASWQVLLIEEEFKRLMFADDAAGGRS